LFVLAVARFHQSKRSDGYYVWNVRGPLGSPEFMPVGGGMGAGAMGVPK
jgi:hypothetical protein